MGKVFGKKAQETVINIKDSTQMIKKMGTVFSHGQVVMSIRETMKQIWDVAMVKCIGMMEASTKANGRKEFNMEKVKSTYLAKDTKKDFSRTMS